MALITGRNHFTPIFSCESSSSHSGHFELFFLSHDSPPACLNAPRSTVASPWLGARAQYWEVRPGLLGWLQMFMAQGVFAWEMQLSLSQQHHQLLSSGVTVCPKRK